MACEATVETVIALWNVVWGFISANRETLVALAAIVSALGAWSATRVSVRNARIQIAETIFGMIFRSRSRPNFTCFDRERCPQTTNLNFGMERRSHRRPAQSGEALREIVAERTRIVIERVGDAYSDDDRLITST
jgi:hypothetical protein